MWYINRKTNELVRAIWEEDVNGKDYSCWFVYKDGRKIAELNVADFQSQYGEAMICPKKDCKIPDCSSLKPHICNSGCTSPSFCPHCVCYTPEQELSDDELQEPKAGAMEMLLEATNPNCKEKPDSSLLLSDEEKQKYIHHSQVNYGDITVDEFDVDIDGLLQAELDHLAKPEMEVYKRIYCKHWDKVNDKCLVSVDDCIRPNFDCYDDIPLSDYMKGEK